MNKKAKVYKPKQVALYSIQFYRDRDGTLNCMETANVGSISDDLHMDINMHMFGRSIANSKFLEKEDKKSLLAFCKAYILTYKMENNL